MKFLWFSHFSGGGGSTLGAIQAGVTPWTFMLLVILYHPYLYGKFVRK